MPSSIEPKSKDGELPDVSILNLEAGDKEVPKEATKKAIKKAKKPVIADSWEDESDEEEDNEQGGVDLDTTANPPSDDEGFETTKGDDAKASPAAETAYLKDLSPFYSGEKSSQTGGGSRRERPATTMMVANRLIASGTGHRIRRTEEQRKADKEKFEKEKARREEEKKRRDEAEKAKKSVWEDD